MDPAPLPPHERNWRHPSELAVTGIVDDDPSRSPFRAVALAGGATMAVLAIVVLATVNAGRSPSPFAVTATTMPTAQIDATRQVATPAQTARAEDTRVWRDADNPMTRTSAVAVEGEPNFVSAAPIVDPDASALDLARALPADDEAVLVLTRSHTYRMKWSEIGAIRAPNDSVVVTVDGELVAIFVSGELRLLVDA